MQRFKQLQIIGNTQTVLELLDTLKTKKGKVFEYNRAYTEDYARNIFRDVAEVGCFKTSRLSLLGSYVWLLFDKDHLHVTNITSDINPSLTKEQYNQVLDSFVSDFVRPFLKDDLANLIIDITPGELSMSDLVSEDSYNALNQWQEAYDKYYMEEDFLTYSMWIKAIVALVKNNDVVDYEDFREWLIDDCGWPESLEETIHLFYLRYEVGRDVLNEWKNES